MRLVLDEGQTVGRVARDLDLTESALRNWVDRARADRTTGRTGLTSEEREELRRLRKENRRLRVERDVLKKAASRTPVSDSQRVPEWLLCLGVSAAVGARAPRSAAAGPDSCLA